MREIEPIWNYFACKFSWRKSCWTSEINWLNSFVSIHVCGGVHLMGVKP